MSSLSTKITLLNNAISTEFALLNNALIATRKELNYQNDTNKSLSVEIKKIYKQLFVDF